MSNNYFQDNNDYSDINNYVLKKTIGKGTFGKVKLAIFKPTNQFFAIKILNKEKIKKIMISTKFKENKIIEKLNHLNIVNVIKIIEDNEYYYIVMEYCNGGELFDYIVKKQRLSVDESSIFFYQIINGVEYIHSQGYAHRDLKPENILILKKNNKNILKIIDFGLSHEYNENDGDFLKTKCGSPSYAAPELIKGKLYNGFKIDIWCCGIILYAMLCGYLPFEGDTNKILFKNIIECKPEIPNFLNKDAKKLILDILNPNPEKRISIEEIKSYDFFLKGKELFNYLYYENNIFENINVIKEDEQNPTIKNYINSEIKSKNNKINNIYEANKTSPSPSINNNEINKNEYFSNKNNKVEINEKRHIPKINIKINTDTESNVPLSNSLRKKLKLNEKIIKNFETNFNQIIKTENNDSNSIKNEKIKISKIIDTRKNNIFKNVLLSCNNNLKSKSPEVINNKIITGENMSENQNRNGKYYKFFDFSLNNRKKIHGDMISINYFKNNDINNIISNNNNINVIGEEKVQLTNDINSYNKGNNNNINSVISNKMANQNNIKYFKYIDEININKSITNNLNYLNSNPLSLNKAYTINKDDINKKYNIISDRIGKKYLKNQILKTPKHISSIFYKNDIINNNNTNIEYSNKNKLNIPNSVDKNLTKTPSSNKINLNKLNKSTGVRNRGRYENNIYRYINIDINRNDKYKSIFKDNNFKEDTNNIIINGSMEKINNKEQNIDNIRSRISDKFIKSIDNDNSGFLLNKIISNDKEKNSNFSSINNNRRNSKIGLFSIKKDDMIYKNDLLGVFIKNNNTSHSKKRNKLKDTFSVNKKDGISNININSKNNNNILPVLPLFNK